jgi:hypothetical protein
MVTRRTGDKNRNDTHALCAATQATTFALAESAPNAETFVVGQRVFQALCRDLTRFTDSFRVARGSTLLREERLGVSLGAQRVGLPREWVVIDVIIDATNSGESKVDGVYCPVVGNVSTISRGPSATNRFSSRDTPE